MAAQPLTDEETLRGATNRARNVLESQPDVDYGRWTALSSPLQAPGRSHRDRSAGRRRRRIQGSGSRAAYSKWATGTWSVASSWSFGGATYDDDVWTASRGTTRQVVLTGLLAGGTATRTLAPPQGRTGVGTSARYELSRAIYERVQAGVELGDVMDAISGQSDVRSKGGAMGKPSIRWP